MRPEEFFLRDIVLACRSSNRFAGEVSRDEFEESDLYQSAIQYQLLIIGEATTHISQELRNRYANVDWRSLKDFRNVLAHDYFALDIEVIWHSATMLAPILCESILKILRAEFPDFPTPDSARLWK